MLMPSIIWGFPCARHRATHFENIASLNLHPLCSVWEVLLSSLIETRSHSSGQLDVVAKVVKLKILVRLGAVSRPAARGLLVPREQSCARPVFLPRGLGPQLSPQPMLLRLARVGPCGGSRESWAALSSASHPVGLCPSLAQQRPSLGVCTLGWPSWG